VAVVGACLEKFYLASTEILETGNVPTYRSKIVINDVRFGLFAPDPGGLDKAEKAFVIMATDKAIRGRHSNLKHVCLVRDMNGHNLAELASSFRDLVADIGKPETQPVDTGHGIYRLPNLNLYQILMGDSRFGANDRNAVDDHVVDCLLQTGRTDLVQLMESFEKINGNPPTSKQIVTLGMALDGHMGNPARYYEHVIKDAPEEWISEFMNKVSLEGLIQSSLAA